MNSMMWVVVIYSLFCWSAIGGQSLLIGESHNRTDTVTAALLFLQIAHGHI